MGSWFHPQSLAMAGGGKSINSMEADRFNPAAIQSNGRIFSISVITYPGDITAESASLLLPTNSNTISINLRHLGYGIFEGRDVNNQSTGNYSSSDTWINASSTWADTNKMYSVGVNSGLFISNLDNVQAVVLTMGFGVLIRLPNDIGKISVSVQNGGIPIDTYTEAETKPPICISLGGSRKLAYLPLELAADAVYYLEEKSTRIHLGGVAMLPYHFQLRFGTTSMKLNQQTSNSIGRDILSDTGFGLSYSFEEYTFDLGMYMYGTGGWASGLGFGIKF
jgi:hypothetical protein